MIFWQYALIAWCLFVAAVGIFAMGFTVWMMISAIRLELLDRRLDKYLKRRMYRDRD